MNGNMPANLISCNYLEHIDRSDMSEAEININIKNILVPIDGSDASLSLPSMLLQRK
jgi:hypothetical protein